MLLTAMHMTSHCQSDGLAYLTDSDDLADDSHGSQHQVVGSRRKMAHKAKCALLHGRLSHLHYALWAWEIACAVDD